ncbi:pectinesterase family protein [Alistipes sp. OttesenSCG-928-L06]|nr:pectinesterase family protein [Alistipes sp. OttesenSCG-928-L06]
MKKIMLALLLAAFCQLSHAVQHITVAKDGSGDFNTVQAAVNSVRVFSPDTTRIFIKAGTYDEKVVIPATHHKIALVGEDVEKTVIRYNDYAARDNMGTFRTYTLKISGNEITLENLTVENCAGRIGQAVALHTDGDRLVFRRCRFVGNQDTIYTGGRTARSYYENCYIEGTTDYIFGPAICYFANCELRSKGNSYLTAASTYEEIPYGYVFYHCRLTGDGTENQRVYLGRPWRPHAAVAFIECEMGAHIRPEGWHNWGKTENESTARYAEYNSRGPGANPEKRVGWSRQLSADEAARCVPEVIFKIDDPWNPAQ